MLILADLGHDPKHWPSQAATAADQSDDRGLSWLAEAATAADHLGGVWVVELLQESFSCEPWEPPVA